MPLGRKNGGPSAVQADERAAWLALVPVVLTGCFYLLPASARQNPFLQFVPQFAAYGALVVWWKANTDVLPALGLSRDVLTQGVGWGIGTGCLLGVINSIVILRVVPGARWRRPVFGRYASCQDARVRDDPLVHGRHRNRRRIEFSGISPGQAVSASVADGCRQRVHTGLRLGSIVAMLVSALVFAFDPFMVMTFRHLHWIAVWDGLIWAGLFLRWRNLVTVDCGPCR